MRFGSRIRQLRSEQGLTLRTVAERVGVDHSFLSKIENNKPGYEPGAETVRALASALGADPLELLSLAGKVPPELQHMAASASGRRFYLQSKAITSPEEWEFLLAVLEQRCHGHTAEGGPGPIGEEIKVRI